MKKKKKSISSVEELLKYFAKDPENVNEYQDPFVIQMSAKFFTEEGETDASRQGLVPVMADAYHDGINFNNSEIQTEKFIEHTKSIPYRPILAYIEDKDGVQDFTGHEVETIVDEETGETTFRYLEKPIGVISEDYEIIYDETAGVNRAVIKGYLFERYADDAIEILNRRRDVDCSVELAINSFSYSADTKLLTIEDYFVRGLTLLGAKYKPGMKGSHVFTYESSQKELENLYNSLTDVQKEQINQIGSALFNLPEKAKEKKGDDRMGATFNCCIKQGETELTFDRSLDDTQTDILFSFIHALGDDTSIYYTWSAEVYEGYVIARNSQDNQKYRFDYTKAEDGKLSFSAGVQVEPFWMTKEEAEAKTAAYEQMQADLEKAQSGLKLYQEAEIKAQKEAILSDTVYSAYASDPEFVELKNNMESIELDDLKVKAELAFAKCVRKNPIQEAKPIEATKTTKTFDFAEPDSYATRLRYGDLFKEKDYIK